MTTLTADEEYQYLQDRWYEYDGGYRPGQWSWSFVPKARLVTWSKGTLYILTINRTAKDHLGQDVKKVILSYKKGGWIAISPAIDRGLALTRSGSSTWRCSALGFAKLFRLAWPDNLIIPLYINGRSLYGNLFADEEVE